MRTFIYNMALLAVYLLATPWLCAETQIFLVRQTWSQKPDGFDRECHVGLPESREGMVPVIVFFHGNGGNAARSLKEWTNLFPNHLVVAAQGYLKSWNIHGERSKAPDVAFFRQLMAKTLETYRFADPANVTLVGSSNGAALIHRLLIEVDEPLFQKAVPLVASMIEQQYHDGSFWMPSSSDTDDYDKRKAPVSGRKILYIHGTEDDVVPFEGGLRFGKFPHLSAPETALQWARVQGFKGEPAEGSPAQNLQETAYSGTDVRFIAVTGGSHGLKPHREAVRARIKKFVEQQDAAISKPPQS